MFVLPSSPVTGTTDAASPDIIHSTGLFPAHNEMRMGNIPVVWPYLPPARYMAGGNA